MSAVTIRSLSVCPPLLATIEILFVTIQFHPIPPLLLSFACLRRISSFGVFFSDPENQKFLQHSCLFQRKSQLGVRELNRKRQKVFAGVSKVSLHFLNIFVVGQYKID